MLLSGLIQSFLVLFLNTLFFYALTCLLKNMRYMDVSWFAGILLLSYFTLFEFDVYEIRPFIVVTLVSVWFIIHTVKNTLLNNLRKPSQSYKKLQEKWQPYFYVQLFMRLFLVQMMYQFLIVFPIIIINTEQINGLKDIDTVGLIFGISALSMLIYGTRKVFLRLKVYKAVEEDLPDENLLNNQIYLGEFLFWLALFKIGLSSSFGILGVISPLTLLALVYLVPKYYKPLRLGFLEN